MRFSMACIYTTILSNRSDAENRISDQNEAFQPFFFGRIMQDLSVVWRSLPNPSCLQLGSGGIFVTDKLKGSVAMVQWRPIVCGFRSW